MTDVPPAADTNVSTEVEAIKASIAAYIDAELDRRQPLYLSALGVAMRAPLSRMRTLTGQTVGSLIEQDFSNRYQIARLGPHKNIIALYKQGHDISDIKPADGVSASGAPRVLYARDLWLAFAVPLTAPFRYIDLKALKFFDTEDSTAPEGHLLIDREYLRGSADSHDPKEIGQRIASWCAKNGIDPTLYLLKQRAPTMALAHGRSVLELMLSSLDRRQLQSVSLPLDVVDALLRNRT